MNENIIKAFNSFQIADLDDDMVGMCKSLVDWIRLLRVESQNISFPNAEAPKNFYKLDPHQPKMELRKSMRKMMAHAVKYQEEPDADTRTINIYIVTLAATYIYHMPTDKMIAAVDIKEFTRDAAKELLLKDNMSPNWLKEPSNRDFTAIML